MGSVIRLAAKLRLSMQAADPAADCLLAVLDGRAGSWPPRLAACLLVLNLLHTGALLAEHPSAADGPAAPAAAFACQHVHCQL